MISMIKNVLLSVHYIREYTATFILKSKTFKGLLVTLHLAKHVCVTSRDKREGHLSRVSVICFSVGKHIMLHHTCFIHDALAFFYVHLIIFSIVPIIV